MRWILVLACCVLAGCGPALAGDSAGTSGDESESTSTAGDGDGDGDGDPTYEATSIAAGDAFSCVVVDGELACFGQHYATPALGTGATPSSDDCAADPYYGCVVDPACCLGDDELVRDLPRVQLSGTPERVAAGNHSVCVVLDDGAVQCWGAAETGILGLGHDKIIGDDELPLVAGTVDLGGPATAVAVARGDEPGWSFWEAFNGHHACALRTDGAVLCWGLGTLGALGYGNADHVGDDESPADVGPVPLPGPASQVVVGGNHTCALTLAGDVHCWGYNPGGRLGVGLDPGDNQCAAAETANCNLAECCVGDDEALTDVGPVPLGDSATQLAAGERGATCALLEGGDVRCWGGDFTEDGQVPLDIDPIDFGGQVIELAGGGTQMAAILDDGTIAMRDNDDGELTLVRWNAPAIAVDVNQYHWCGLLADRSARCWSRRPREWLGYPVPPECYTGETLNLTCEVDAACCLGDDEPLDAWGPLPL